MTTNTPTVLNDADRPHLPIIFLALGFLFLVVYQNIQLNREQADITRIEEQQAKLIEQGLKVQQQLDTLAVGTLQLANGGNESAKLIVQNLERAGVSINPKKAQ